MRKMLNEIQKSTGFPTKADINFADINFAVLPQKMVFVLFFVLIVV